MRIGIQQTSGVSQRFKNWESLSRVAGCSTPHSVRASSRRFPVLLIHICAGLPRSQIGVTGTDPGRVIASPGNGTRVGAGMPCAIHAGSSRVRPKRSFGASPGAVVGGAGTFDGMFDRVDALMPAAADGSRCS